MTTQASADNRYVLAIDLGTSGCKCALVTLDGAVHAWAFRPVALRVQGALAEQDPHEWWAAFLGAAGELLAGDAARRRRVVAVCASTQAEVTVCVDRAGEPLAPAISWLDSRGAAAIRRRARGRLFNIEGYGPLKLWRWLRLTGGAPSGTGRDSAGHIAWVRDEAPAVYERTHKFLNALDYLNLRLCGRLCATQDSILTAWVTDNRDASHVRYDAGLIRQLGVAAEKLPELVKSTDVIGTLLPAVADALGLDPATRVVAGAMDNSAVAVGAAVSDYETHLYLGTSSWLGAHLPFMKTDLRHKIAAVPCAVQGRYLAMALQSTAGANLSFLRDRILYHPDELASDEEHPAVYDALSRIAAQVPPGARGLIYMPWLLGERTPVDDPRLRAGLVNLSLEHSREDIFRAFLEGVALNTRWMLEPFTRLLGRDTGAIVAVGGGAQSEVWCQIIADVTGRPIRQLESPIQANAIGAGFLAGIGLGELGFADLPALRRSRCVHEPRHALRQLHADQFETFKEVHRRLAPLYQRLNTPDHAPEAPTP
ncbi:xylulokinase [Roseateles saccharophilus]|uniref:Xylulokinase n=1 Tax=Roseateles saccharophilus TaxID=304 RepID=A0A4R3UZE9_ROSSA|nr:FGGY-family carbohydrate kinase [Roseateles saccharophilus]MDG0832700.1 xylulose kinase [Roseateles saccharophilus]TCU95364.1 xylulokinase [Roseateles saccharophilus]